MSSPKSERASDDGETETLPVSNREDPYASEFPTPEEKKRLLGVLDRFFKKRDRGWIGHPPKTDPIPTKISYSP